jgi:hypothetical protein
MTQQQWKERKMFKLKWATPEVMRGFREWYAGPYTIRHATRSIPSLRRIEDFYVVLRDGQHIGDAATLREAKVIAQRDSDTKMGA